jgi:hypothetical protein
MGSKEIAHRSLLDKREAVKGGGEESYLKLRGILEVNATLEASWASDDHCLCEFSICAEFATHEPGQVGGGGGAHEASDRQTLVDVEHRAPPVAERCRSK